MIKHIIQKVFDVREGEFKVSFLMTGYIFLIIAVLLIIKPTVNALFLSALGVEQLPIAFLLVALTAVLSSFAYSKALTKFSLQKLIEVTLISSIVVLLCLAVLLYLNLVNGWALYFFYVWVAIYAVLSASQFWVLANMVFNVREAKRLFGFIGSGAILGGIFGGYATSLLAPFVETEMLLFLAASLLLSCIPLLRNIWKLRVSKLNIYKQTKRSLVLDERPFALIKKSKHLTYIALMVAVSVLVAKLVDYLFSDFASNAIPDTEELTSFFGFWFSTFNLVSLMVQLFITHRIVGIWGVGFSLFLLPFGIFLGGVTFFILPELSVVVAIKAMDGILKQSIHKSATELLALPLPFDLKNKTKSFIDVVVDSIATGLAGFVLIFVVKGLELPSAYIVGIILGLVLVWVFIIFQVRKEYFKTFRNNLERITQKTTKNSKTKVGKASVVDGMRTVFRHGTEQQILFMLGKLLEINDKRFLEDVQGLLTHQSNKVRTLAIQNLYYLDGATVISNIPELLASEDEDLILATLEYLLRHAGNDSEYVYTNYLTHKNQAIADAALYCLAREARDNYTLRNTYRLKERIQEKITLFDQSDKASKSFQLLLRTIGFSNFREFYPLISEAFKNDNVEVVHVAIEAAGTSMDKSFLTDLLSFLPQKQYRNATTTALRNYGVKMVSELTDIVKERKVSTETLRFIPMVISSFGSQEAVRHLFLLLNDPDLAIRLEVIRALSEVRANNPVVKLNKYKIVDVIFEECKLYHQTLSSMHTQIIISYRNRKKSNKEISIEERDARTSLLELLERRLDAGLERIFKLLGLKYAQNDVEIAYQGLLSDKAEARTNAIEFLDNLLTGNLKRTLLPIIEDSSLDISSEEVQQKIKHKIPTEQECFQLLLQGNDLKVKLAVLYLIKQQSDNRYLPLLLPLLKDEDKRIVEFAEKAYNALSKK